jgi:hypothetical protein
MRKSIKRPLRKQDDVVSRVPLYGTKAEEKMSEEQFNALQGRKLEAIARGHITKSTPRKNTAGNAPLTDAEVAAYEKSLHMKTGAVNPKVEETNVKQTSKSTRTALRVGHGKVEAVKVVAAKDVKEPKPFTLRKQVKFVARVERSIAALQYKVDNAPLFGGRANISAKLSEAAIETAEVKDQLRAAWDTDKASRKENGGGEKRGAKVVLRTLGKAWQRLTDCGQNGQAAEVEKVARSYAQAEDIELDTFPGKFAPKSKAAKK